MKDPNGFIVVSVLVTGTTTAVNELAKGELKFSTVLGSMVLGIFLFAVALVNENLAASLALLIMLTTLAINGKPVFEFLNKLAKG